MPIISCMDNRRNGLDALSFTLVMIALVLAVLTSVIDDDLIKLVPGALSMALIILALLRMLSTNTARRRYENDRFISFFKKDPYKRFSCPRCKTLCRVPRGKGKIKIKCPSCGEEFIRRT